MIRAIPVKNTPFIKNTPLKCPRSVQRGGILNKGIRHIIVKHKRRRRKIFIRIPPLLRIPPLKCPKSVQRGGILKCNSPDATGNVRAWEFKIHFSVSHEMVGW